MKLKRLGDLLLSLGGPNAVVRHAGGVNWRGGKKKNDWRELPQRSARYEIGPFSSRSPLLLKKKIGKISGERQTETQPHPQRSPRREHIAPFCRRISRDLRCMHSISALVRARVCVFTSVWTSATNEGRRRIKPRKEGWWTIQAVVRHKWWVVVPLGVLSSFLWSVNELKVLRKTQFDRLLFTEKSQLTLA